MISWLKEKEIDTIFFKKRKNFSYLANLSLHGYGVKDIRKAGEVFIEREGISLITKGRKEKEGFLYEKGGEVPDLNPDKRPRILIDLGFSNLLKEEEKKSLELQLRYILHISRSLYWETSVYTIRGISQFFKELEDYPKDIILLDPYGEKEFEGMKEGKTYLILGIVDKGNRLKGATSKFGEEMGFKTERISLRGKLEGVCSSLDCIVKILFLTLRGFSVEDAILLSSPERLLEYRIEGELKRKEPDLELVKKIKKFLSIDREKYLLKKF